MRVGGSHFVSAVVGGGASAAVLLVAGVAGPGTTRTVVQQAPLSVASPVHGGRSGDGLTAAEVYERRAAGVAFVRARTLAATPSPFEVYDAAAAGTQSTGSGFVIDDEGHVLTTAHVVDHATAVTVTLGATTRTAEIVGKDDATDLALLKVDPAGLDLRPLELGDSSAVRVGDPAVAIGNPFGSDRTLTTGIVSAVQRRISAPGGATVEDVIQTDAELDPGSSGGPLIDATGRVIGVTSQLATGAAAVGFAVPVDTVRRVLAELKTAGRVERPWLGARLVPLDAALQRLGVGEDGLLVQDVKPGGPAARAGLRGGDRGVALASGDVLLLGGDVVTAVDGQAVDSTEDVDHVLAARSPGDVVDLTVRRATGVQTVRVELGNRPAASAGDS